MQLFVVCKKDATDEEIAKELSFVAVRKYTDNGDLKVYWTSFSKEHLEGVLFGVESNDDTKGLYEIRTVDLTVRTTPEK